MPKKKIVTSDEERYYLLKRGNILNLRIGYDIRKRWSLNQLRQEYNFDDYYIIKRSAYLRLLNDDDEELLKWSGLYMVPKKDYPIYYILYILKLYNDLSLKYIEYIIPDDIVEKVEFIQL